jgi:hypothetical protein
MAALAIDVAGLYLARGEAQRAADAAALAGAKMFVSSSYTSKPAAYLNLDVLCKPGAAGSTAAVNQQAELAARANRIAGQPAAVRTIGCNFDTAHENRNPSVTVTVERVNTPTFFARIWGANTGTVTATATAEAYNASGQDTPIQLTNVKPWLIPNCDPNGPHGPCPGGYFIDPATGKIKGGGSFIGTLMQLNRLPTGPVGGNGGSMDFNGLHYPNSPAPVCPSTSAVSCGSPVGDGDNYIDNVACTSRLSLYCGQKIGPGFTPEILIEAETLSTTTPTSDSTKCLIHAAGLGPNQGQDSFSNGGPPVSISGGDNNPNVSLRVPNISRSDSVVTVPIYDGHQMCFDSATPTVYGTCVNTSPLPATVIGFLQLGIKDTGGGQTLNSVILNAVGCSQNAITASPSPNSVSGESSPIPVRLVQAR